MKKTRIVLLLFLFPLWLFAQEKMITGKVTDNAGQGIPGVNVVIKGTTTGAITNADGMYRISAAQTEGTILSFSFIGFKTQEIALGTSSTIDVILEPGDINLDEVVVTAMGIKRDAKSLVYARQSVNAEDMTEARSTNLINSLAGKAAGVQVINSGTPTGTNRVVIRGLTSVTGNNQPLYVVDGVSLDNTQGDAKVSVWNGGDDLDYGSPISQINPDDIESIDILKGPNAAALYGSRASNGVVLITTKQGKKKSGLGISFNSNTSFTSNSELPYHQYVYGTGDNGRLVTNINRIDPVTGLPMLGAYSRAYGAAMLGQQVLGYNGKVMDYTSKPHNVEELFQTGVTLVNGVSIEKAYQDGAFRLSYTNTNSEWVMENQEVQKRHNLSFRGLQNIGKSLSADISLLYTNDQVDNRLYKNGSERNPAYNYLYLHPGMDNENLYPYKDEFGNALRFGTAFVNPLWGLNENSNRDESNRIIGNVTLKWEITKELNLKGKVMGDINTTEGEEFNDMGAVYDLDGFYRAFNNQSQNWNYEATLNYNKKFQKISVVGLLGANRFDSKLSRRETKIGALLVHDVASLANSNAIPAVAEIDGDKRINSVFGSFSVGYDDTYYIDATARNDWSSTLPAENNSYFYPSIGTSVIFSELLPENNILTFGKVRASYAQVGNDTSPYRVLTTYSYGGIYNNTAWLALQPTRNNPLLKPELTSSWEFGLEASFINNRVSLNGTYYNSSTTDQIIPAQTTASTGFSTQYYNAGEIQSEGWEIVLSGKPIDNKFKWNINVNWAKNESMVVSLIEGVDRLLLREWFNARVWAEVGKPLGEIRGNVQLKDPETGTLLVTAQGLSKFAADTRLGNAQPDWIGGINNSFSYKGFSLSFLVDMKMGGDVYSATMLKALNQGIRGETFEGRAEYNFSSNVLGENDNERRGIGLFGNTYKDIERESGTRYENASVGVQDANGNWVATRDADGNIVYATMWVNPQNFNYDQLNKQESITYDASYIKLRELIFGYDFPKTLLQKTPIQGARISLVGRNLYTFYENMPQGLDPEAGTTSGNGQGIEFGSFLPTRTLGFNIKLTF